MFANAENVTCPNDKEHHSLDIWQITAKAYDDILNRPPHEVALRKSKTMRLEKNNVAVIHGIAYNGKGLCVSAVIELLMLNLKLK